MNKKGLTPIFAIGILLILVVLAILIALYQNNINETIENQDKHNTVDLFESCCEGCSYQIDILQREANTTLSISKQSLMVIPCWELCANNYLEHKEVKK